MRTRAAATTPHTPTCPPGDARRLTSLRPTSDEQKQHLATTRELRNTVFETKLTMIRSLINPVPNSLFNIVLGWSCILFFSYGLLSAINALTTIMAALGAAAVGSTAFLILELSYPYSGLFKMSPAGFDCLNRAHVRGRREEGPVVRMRAASS